MSIVAKPSPISATADYLIYFLVSWQLFSKVSLCDHSITRFLTSFTAVHADDAARSSHFDKRLWHCFCSNYRQDCPQGKQPVAYLDYSEVEFGLFTLMMRVKFDVESTVDSSTPNSTLKNDTCQTRVDNIRKSTRHRRPLQMKISAELIHETQKLLRGNWKDFFEEKHLK